MSSQSFAQLIPDEIKLALRNNDVNWIKSPEYFESIASTNDYLLAAPDSVHGRVCIADYQTRGKGRRGKLWHSSRGNNLMFSLGWVPSGPLYSEVSLLAGVALADVLTKAGIEGVGLKWPNDVLVGGRKLAGILIESRFRSQQAEIVMGIGLNIRHQKADLDAVERPWTDMMRLGVENVNRQYILIGVLTELARRLEQFEAQGFDTIREDWLAYHLYQGVQMNYQHQGETRIGRVAGLDKNGALMFESDGKTIAVSSGEVNCLRVTA